MSDRRAQKINRLIDPLRIAPGSKIVLARDCDPGYKSGGLTKQDGEEQLGLGIEMLSEYQDRLAAQDTGQFSTLQMSAQPVALAALPNHHDSKVPLPGGYQRLFQLGY